MGMGMEMELEMRVDQIREISISYPILQPRRAVCTNENEEDQTSVRRE